MRNWTPGVPIAAAAGMSAAVFSKLPAQVQLPMDAIFPVALIPATGEALPRAGAALLLPAVAALVWALLAGVARLRAPVAGFPTWLASEDTDARAVARFESTYHTLIFAIVTCVVAFHFAVLGSAIGWPAWSFQIAHATVGAALMTAGNVLPRSRPNWIVGLRTRATLASAAVWMRTHRLFGAFLMILGLVVILAAAIAPALALITAAVGILVAAIVAHALGTGGESTRVVAAFLFISVATALPLGRLKAQASPGSAAPRADTVAPSGVTESEVSIRTRDIVLPGTLAMRSGTTGAVPLVVMVAGSGPTDRNGNGPLTQTNTYAQLAWALARSGIATLRYDKRGIGPSAMTLDHASLTIDDYVADVMTAVSMMRADSRFSSVFVLGHSEGAMHALLSANRGARVDGVILLSGTGRPLGAVIHDQYKPHVDSASLAQIDAAWERLMRGEEPAPYPAIAQPLLGSPYRRMLRSMGAYDPPSEIRRATVPVMVVQGGMDWQVTLEDAAELRKGKPDATWLLIPQANHVFKAAEAATAVSQQAQYRDKGLPLVSELASGVSAFVAAWSGPRR